MKFNLIKKNLNKKKCAFGTWTMLPSGASVDVITRTGVDFIIIDMEHGLIDWQTANEMVRAAYANRCQPVIRTSNHRPDMILHALETGANAIMVPNVSDENTAKSIALAARYAPMGMRGVSPYTCCHGFTHAGFKDSLTRNNKQLLLGVMVEGEQGIQNIKKISDVQGVDLIYLGIYDLSQSVGKTGQLNHPKVQQQLRKCLKIIKDAKKIAGTFAESIETAKKYRQMGFTFIAYVADSFGLRNFYEKSVTIFRNSK